MIGRFEERKQFDAIIDSNSASFVELYGRIRVDKTFLIKNYFNNKSTFYFTGLVNANTHAQLINFTNFSQEYFNTKLDNPTNWI